MPIYVYIAEDAEKSCSRCRRQFDVQRHMDDPPLLTCPDCGARVRRVWTSVNVGKSSRNVLSDSHLKRHGFQKLVNEGEGKFRKTV
jgi:putative FmdB family regulatory protein